MNANFTTGEASRLAGFEKPWMLGHLEREGIFVREHRTDRRHGRVKKYTFADIVILRAINRMLVLGARPARIKTVIATLGKLEGLNGSQRTIQALLNSIGTCLFVNEHEAFIRRKEDIIDLLQDGQLAFGFMIDFHEAVRPVAKLATLYRKRRRDLWKVDKELLEDMCAAAGI